jgi:hypothetical protein
LTKIVPIQKGPAPKNLLKHVMRNIRILFFSLSRVVENFKLNISITQKENKTKNRDLNKKWKIATIENLAFFVFEDLD